MTDVVFGIAVACAVVFSVVAMLLVVVQMPSSSPPSEGRALAFGFVFWLLGLVSLVAAPIVGDLCGDATRWWVWLGCALTVVVFASATGAAFESAILDGCDFGTGSGDQNFCIPRADSLPAVRVAWLMVGGAVSVAAAILVRLARRWKVEHS